MKLTIILFLSCITIATCKRSHGCQWSGCEEKPVRGETICRRVRRPYYTGQTNDNNCTSKYAKAECCDPTPSGEGCKWTKTCYGDSYDGESACEKEYGAGYFENDQLSCSNFEVAFECCAV